MPGVFFDVLYIQSVYIQACHLTVTTLNKPTDLRLSVNTGKTDHFDTHRVRFSSVLHAV